MTKAPLYKDTDLIIALKQGEEFAYSCLYDSYGSALYGFIIQLIPEQEIAQDILREVFIKIFQNINQYDNDTGLLYTWIINLTRSTAIERINNKNFQTAGNRLPSTEQRKHQLGSGYGVPDMNNIEIITIIADMDETNKRIIDLAFFRGFTSNQIAEELEIPVGHIKLTVRNAIIQLRKLFGFL